MAKSKGKARFTPASLDSMDLVETSPGSNRYVRRSTTAMLEKALKQADHTPSLFNQNEVAPEPVQKGKSLTSPKKPVNHVTGYIEDQNQVSDLFRYMRATDIFIPVMPVSSKNSKQIGKIGSAARGTEKTILRKSDAAAQYDIDAAAHLLVNRLKFAAGIRDKPKPYYLYFTFIMSRASRFDYVNMVQGILDLMQREDLAMLEDDDFSNVVPVFNKNVYKSVTTPGVIIQVISGIEIIL